MPHPGRASRPLTPAAVPLRHGSDLAFSLADDAVADDAVADADASGTPKLAAGSADLRQAAPGTTQRRTVAPGITFDRSAAAGVSGERG